MKKNIFRTMIIVILLVTIPFPSFAVNEDYIPIQIDGYYDDWEDKPSTEVYPGHNPPQSKINDVSLFRDEDNVYIHVLFATKNNQDITNMIINLYTNMGDERYFLVPDYFWFPDMQSEPDMAPDQSEEPSPLTQTPAPEEGNGTESIDQNAAEEQGGTAETPEPDNTTTDQGGTAEPTQPTDTTNTTESSVIEEQNILAGHEIPSYDLIADNDKTDPAADPAATETDTTTVTTDEKTNNDQGNGSENNLPDVLDPGNLVDLDNVLDQFSQDEDVDSSIPDDSAELNSNLNIKKPGWYGTWGFSVYNGLFPVGSGYYKRSAGNPDELELYIPLSSIAHHYDGITEISMRIKKLGPQYIMCTGVSTGAYIGVSIGAGIALMSVGAYTYKRKRPFALGKGK